MSGRKIVVLLADTHGGHRLGLLDPDVWLYEESAGGDLQPYHPTLTATQEYLWYDCYKPDIQRVVDLADGDPIIVLHVGDLTQGVKYKTQLVSTRIADQLSIAEANILPWLRIPNVTTLRLVVGTASHLLGEASSPVILSKMLKPQYPDRDISVVRHDRPTIDNVILDAAHHGPSSGIREWTQGNQLRYYARSLVIHDILRGKHPPTLIVRAHFHKLWPETVRIRLSAVLREFLRQQEQPDPDYTALAGINRDAILVHKVDIVLLPSYCGMGEYGRMATGSSSTLSNGLVALELIDGNLARTHYFEREIDLRREETL